MVAISHNPAQTETIAANFAATLQGGEVIALHGDLGAGKTQFVRGMLRGLGGDTRSVNSPTYLLLNIYDTGRLTLYHLDAYRVGGSDDFAAIGFAELLDQGGVVVVEWASRVAELLPEKHIAITIEAIGPHDRSIAVRTG